MIYKNEYFNQCYLKLPDGRYWAVPHPTPPSYGWIWGELYGDFPEPDKLATKKDIDFVIRESPWITSFIFSFNFKRIEHGIP